MTNKELVNQISGLNSTSTLKNWIQLIKEIVARNLRKLKFLSVVTQELIN